MDASPAKLNNVVTCLRSMHQDQSGAVVVLLVEKMMSAGHIGISRLADSVACRRVEVLLAEEDDVSLYLDICVLFVLQHSAGFLICIIYVLYKFIKH